MNVRVFTLPFDPGIPGFDDGAVQQFCTEHIVTQVIERFFTVGDVPHWSLMLLYRPLPRPVDRALPVEEPQRRNAVDAAQLLDPEQRLVFERLRDWRNQRARQEGKPAYVLLTNHQLVEVVRARPRTVAELRTVPGIGDAKVAAFGAELLLLLTPNADALVVT
jgi:superfamily II DNA helicase RecQ